MNGNVELWMIHASLMSLGFFLVIVNLSNVVFKIPVKGWFRIHKIAGILSVMFLVLGISVAIFMVSQFGGSHFRVYHAYFGLSTLILLVLTPVIGYLSSNLKQKRYMRSIHIWIGRIDLLMIMITLISGLMQVGII